MAQKIKNTESNKIKTQAKQVKEGNLSEDIIKEIEKKAYNEIFREKILFYMIEHDESKSMRMGAAKIIGKKGLSNCILPLAELFEKEEDPDVKYEIGMAIREILESISSKSFRRLH
jgi:HEAT repeat protein